MPGTRREKGLRGSSLWASYAKQVAWARCLPCALLDSCTECMFWCAEVCHAFQVRGNADYIVDGLCRQLRHLEDHPRCFP